MSGAYRDGVFSVASPAPRYGSLSTSFENGSLGEILEDNAAALLNPALDAFATQLAMAMASLPPNGAAAAAAAAGVELAKYARSLDDINDKLAYTIGAAYAGSHFALPPNTLLATVEQICDSFAMTGNQRAALHQQAARALRSYVSSEKGNPMSGVFRDGVLGSAYHDGVLGGAYRDGSLGEAYRDGSLGVSARLIAGNKRYTAVRPRLVKQARQTSDGSLGASPFAIRTTSPVSTWSAAPSTLFLRKRKRRALQGGCGCAGLGAEIPPTTAGDGTKKALYLGGAAVALGIVFYLAKKRR